jgi:hypothetical protein
MLRHLHEKYQFFRPSNAPRSMANRFFLGHANSIGEVLDELRLWSGFCASSLGIATFSAALKLSGEHMRDLQTITRLLDWATRLRTPVVKTDLRVLFADALLRPWANQVPPAAVKNRLVDLFLTQYGDPRRQDNLQFHWAGVSEQAKGVLFKWLTGDTLRGFIKVLQKTADEIWQYRQKFWMAYYENGFIDEAWIALGEHASLVVTGVPMDDLGMGCGRLEGGAAKNQSVLLLKIGGLVFTEWSHNGSLRAYPEDGLQAPRLYERSYHGSELRAARSLDFHDGGNQRPELTHAHSEVGSWQRKARDFIKRHTGIYLSDSEIA